MSTHKPTESSKKDVRTSDSDEDQDNYWDEELLRAVQRKVGKSEKAPEKVTLNRMTTALDEGANIDVQNCDGDTALHVAIKKNYQRIVEFLLNRGAKTDIKNCNRETAMILAECLQNKDIVGILRKHVDQRNEPGVRRSSEQSIVSVTDEQELSTSGNAAMATQPTPLTVNNRPKRIGPREGSHSTGQQGEANKVAGYEGEDFYDSKKSLTAARGPEYQQQHLAFTLLCALQRKDPEFYLATEMVEAHNFDDVVLRYKNDYGEQVGRFVQIKHKSDEKSMISASMLLDAGGHFSVPSYFISWRRIKENKQLFKENMVRHMILCTNWGLNLESMKNQIKYDISKDPDVFFELKSDSGKTAWYQFQANAISNKTLYDKLKETADGSRLAEQLATCICEAKHPRLQMEMFGLYHLALAKYVFDPTRKVFHDTFFEKENLPEAVGKFREAFLLKFRKRRNDPKINKSDELAWTEIRNLFKELTFQKDFGKVPESKTKKSTNQVPESQIYLELPVEYSVAEAEINIFLGEFTLAVNQPDRKELSTLIKSKIHVNDRFDLPDSEILADAFVRRTFDWFLNENKQGQKAEYFSSKVVEKFIRKIEDEVNAILTKGAIPVYCEWITKYDVHFKTGMQQVKDFLAEDGSKPTSHRILNLVAPNETLLTALKVYDTLQRITKYGKSDSFIFTRMDDLPSSNGVVKPFSDFQRYCDLLIVDCGSNSTEILDPLYEIIADQKHKKMIVITRKGENLSTRLNHSSETYFEQVENLSFSNLTNDSQKKVLGKQVTKFQGQNSTISFGELLGIDDCDNFGEVELKDLSKIIDSSALVQLISGDGIQIGMDIEGLEDISHCYIHRTICRQVVIKEDILKDDKIPDLFAISGINRSLLAEPLQMRQASAMSRNFMTDLFVQDDMDCDISSKSVQTGETSTLAHSAKNFTILVSNQEDEQFNALCARHEHCNVHWLQWKTNIWNNDEYVWKKSRGNITSLFEYRDATASADNHDGTSATDLSKVDFTTHDEPVIISAAAGMGKTTVLTNLASNMKKKEPDMLVLKIDLNHHATALEKVKKDCSYDLGSINGAVQFLVKELSNGEIDLARKVFERIIKKKYKVGLLFDGFDEISPDYEDTVIDLLDTLVKYGIKKLFVATRPHTRERVEKRLNAFSYDMKPFSAADQERFLTDFWKDKFENLDSDSKQRTEHRIIKYTTALMKKLADSINDQENKFTGNPLQAYLVAEVFGNLRETARKTFDSCKDFIDSEVDEPKFPEKINLIYLYEHFVEKKFEVYFERTGADLATVAARRSRKECFDKFVDKHKQLALYSLFGKKKIKELLFSHKNWSHESLETTDADIVERDGIVTRFINSEPQFGHRTYAEYFAAKFFSEVLKIRPQNELSAEIFVVDVLLRGNHGTMRAFMDWLLSDERAYVLEGDVWPIYLKKFRSQLNQTIFHIAAAEGNGHILRLFLNCLSANTEYRGKLIRVGDIFGRTAVHRAVEYGYLDNIRLLIEETDFDVNFKNNPGSTLLQLAALVGKLDVVEFLVNKGANINSQNKNGGTPLYFATSGGKLDVVEFLVGKGANIDSQDEDGNTPLHVAAQARKLDVVEFLVSKGTNIDSRKKNGSTPLHVATLYKGNLDVVKFLVSKGANIDSQDEDDNTPLHFAAQARKLDVVKFLVSKVANIDSQDKNGDTPLHVAARVGKLDVVEFLVSKGANIDSQDTNGGTPLHVATLYEGNLDVVEFLVSKRANIDSQEKDGYTPLHFAAQEGKLDVVEFLVSKGANIDSQRKNDVTPLHVAAQVGKLDVVEFLVSKGAKIDSQEKDGCTPLHFAAQEGKLDVVEFFVSKGANIDSQRKNDVTPLHVADQVGKLDVVEFLVSKGANIDSQDKNGVTPLHIAAQKKKLDVVELLVSNGANVNVHDKNGVTPLHIAARKGKFDIVDFLVSEGANVDSQDKNGGTPLHIAVRKRKLDVVEFLVSNGANVNVHDKNGVTPLHFAAVEGKLDVVEFFVSKGANIDFQDKNGATPLHFAAVEGKLDVVEFFVSKGANIDFQDKNGATPLHVAAEVGKLDVVEFLVSKGANRFSK